MKYTILKLLLISCLFAFDIDNWTYFKKTGSIDSWKIDHVFLNDIWGFDLSRVNLGIPYFSMVMEKYKIKGEPSWSVLSGICPNIAKDINVCNGTTFIGKQMNYKLGKFAKETGFGGVFPWTLNYDSFENNNTLIDYLYEGIQK